MKILFVHHNAGRGGASNSLYYLVKEFDPKYYEIHIITPKGPVSTFLKQLTPNIHILEKGQIPNFFSLQGVPFIGLRMFLSFLKNYKVIDEVEQIANSVRPDIIHLNDNGQVFLAKRLKMLGYPIVMHSRSLLSSHFLHRGINHISEKLIDQYVDKLLAISQSVKNGFKTVKNIEIVYNPYNSIEHNTPNQRVSKQLNCLFLANFLSFKGIYETIEAAIVLKENSNINFYIAGDNVRNDDFFNSPIGRIVDYLGLYPSIKKWIKKKIKKHDLKNVHLLGYVEDLPTLLKDMHISLAPMRLNAPPRSIFEVGMYGVPSILALKNVTSDTIEDGITGIVIPERDVKSLVQSILKLEQDEQLRYTMGYNSIKKYSVLHNPTKIYNFIIKIYKELIT